ncbi:hypothetical protein V8B97DRAFT_1328665 [Scleroderma yunnanense]
MHPRRGQRAWGRGATHGRGRGGNQHPNANANASTRLRKMELMPSVSRSSGIGVNKDADGDSLKNYRVQEEYRAFIDGKLNVFWDRYASTTIDSAERQRVESQTNILILLRKLREGLLASGRKDAFAIEVYETSLCLSILFESSVASDTTSILSWLPSMYARTSELGASSTTAPMTIIIYLLHLLLTGYPSQLAYLDYLKTLTLRRTSRQEERERGVEPYYVWIRALACALRRYQFTTFDKLSRATAFERSYPHLSHASSSHPRAMGPYDDLAKAAIHALLTRLRLKVRETAWGVMRRVYREVSLSDDDKEEEQGRWLGRYLALDGGEGAEVEWMEGRMEMGHVISKKDRQWMVCRVR